MSPDAQCCTSNLTSSAAEMLPGSRSTRTVPVPYLLAGTVGVGGIGAEAWS